MWSMLKSFKYPGNRTQWYSLCKLLLIQRWLFDEIPWLFSFRAISQHRPPSPSPKQSKRGQYYHQCMPMIYHHLKKMASKIINRKSFLNLTGFGKWKSDYLSFKWMLDYHKCFECIIIPNSNVGWLTFSTSSTGNLATCDQKSIWIWMECQAKNNGINSFSRRSFVLYVMNWYSRRFLNYKLWILSIWIFEFPSS